LITITLDVPSSGMPLACGWLAFSPWPGSPLASTDVTEAADGL
jgi:hypothetical protein